eukprot:TRINITY_DN38531_c0_g1_i1.p1 TRINITY_DN38531_c0_g1~~TRINITY_DN38531_c0_g1_i1.p1  ORF type:complete len:768 (-),score=117.43 TRINITY_DN38531_c0_g1_i1:52-2355(-)
MSKRGSPSSPTGSLSGASTVAGSSCTTGVRDRRFHKPVSSGATKLCLSSEESSAAPMRLSAATLQGRSPSVILAGLRVFVIERYGSLDAAFDRMDFHRDGRVSCLEFQEVLCGQERYCGLHESRDIFRLLARGTDGWITREHLRERLSSIPEDKTRLGGGDNESGHAIRDVQHMGSNDASFVALENLSDARQALRAMMQANSGATAVREGGCAESPGVAGSRPGAGACGRQASPYEYSPGGEADETATTAMSPVHSMTSRSSQSHLLGTSCLGTTAVGHISMATSTTVPASPLRFGTSSVNESSLVATEIGDRDCDGKRASSASPAHSATTASSVLFAPRGSSVRANSAERSNQLAREFLDFLGGGRDGIDRDENPSVATNASAAAFRVHGSSKEKEGKSGSPPIQRGLPASGGPSALQCLDESLASFRAEVAALNALCGDGTYEFRNGPVWIGATGGDVVSNVPALPFGPYTHSSDNSGDTDALSHALALLNVSSSRSRSAEATVSHPRRFGSANVESESQILTRGTGMFASGCDADVPFDQQRCAFKDPVSMTPGHDRWMNAPETVASVMNSAKQRIAGHFPSGGMKGAPVPHGLSWIQCLPVQFQGRLAACLSPAEALEVLDEILDGSSHGLEDEGSNRLDRWRGSGDAHQAMDRRVGSGDRVGANTGAVCSASPEVVAASAELLRAENARAEALEAELRLRRQQHETKVTELRQRFRQGQRRALRKLLVRLDPPPTGLGSQYDCGGDASVEPSPLREMGAEVY